MITFHNPSEIESIKSAIITDGYSVVRDISEETAFVEYVRNFGVAEEHRDSGDHAITRVEYDPNRFTRPGFSGFSNGALELHTDRSTLPVPPNLVFLFCNQRASGIGGVSRLLDGKFLFKLLDQLHPELFGVMTEQNLIRYDDGTRSYTGAIFERLDNGRIIFRFRVDGNGFYSFDISPYIERLLTIMRNNDESLQLEVGDLLIVDNHRCLHGRTAFKGTRSLLRILAKADGWLQPGFSVQ